MSDNSLSRYSITITNAGGSVFTKKVREWNWVNPDATVLQFVDDQGQLITVRPGCATVVIRQNSGEQSSE